MQTARRVARRAVRRLEVLDDIYGTAVSFALGALVVFIGLYPAMIRQEGELQAARRSLAYWQKHQRSLDAQDAKQQGLVFEEP